MKNSRHPEKGPRSYRDMLLLPHHQSAVHPHMSPMERAAQFSPFSALTGYEEEIRETARLTCRKIDLDENARALLDETLHVLEERLSEHPEISVTCFVPDAHKEGGAYVTVTGKLKKIDRYGRTLFLSGLRDCRPAPGFPVLPSDSAPAALMSEGGWTSSGYPLNTGQSCAETPTALRAGHHQGAGTHPRGAFSGIGKGNGETAVPIDRIFSIQFAEELSGPSETV